MVPRCSDKIARVSSYSSSLTGWCFRIQGYHLLWPDFPDCSTSTHPITTTGLFPVRSPLLGESRLISFPPVTEMFQFTGFAPYTYEFSARYLLRGGFPHSEIAGSKLVCQLADAYRSEEHTSELQSQSNLVCRLLLDKKKYLPRITLRYITAILDSSFSQDLHNTQPDDSFAADWSVAEV